MHTRGTPSVWVAILVHTLGRPTQRLCLLPPSPSLSLDIVGKEGKGGGENMRSRMMFSVARYEDFAPDQGTYASAANFSLDLGNLTLEMKCHRNKQITEIVIF